MSKFFRVYERGAYCGADDFLYLFQEEKCADSN